MPSQKEIREKVTKTIIEALEKSDLPPWRRPWKSDINCGCPTNIVSGKKYRGINPLILQASMRHGFSSKWFGTFRQWKELGGHVKKRPNNVPSGEWGSTIIFYSAVSKKKSDEDGKKSEDRFFILKSYTVFNVDQVEGDHLDHLRAGHGEAEMIDTECIEARRVIDATCADIRHGGNQAYYKPVYDYIRLPNPTQMDAASYYETAFHELCHWTENRLDWKGSYSMGELIAEIASCFLCSEVGVPMSNSLDNHASYIASWLQAMKQDPKYIFTAAAQANKVTDYILSFSRATEPVCAE